MKLKEISWKKVLNVTIWSVLIVMMFTALGFVSEEENRMLCKELKIKVDNTKSGMYFVEPEDVDELIKSKAMAPVGTAMGNLETGILEKMLQDNPYILNAEVFTTINGEMKIEVAQRIPVLRIINASGENYYVDENGSRMPVSDKFSVRTLVASGNITDSYLETLIHPVYRNIRSEYPITLADSLFMLSKCIRENDFMNSLTEQIFVNADREFEIVPKVGQFAIVLGDISFLEDKFQRLQTFYKKALYKSGMDAYSVLNLKYKDQVVCTKNPLLNTASIKPIK